MVRIGYINTMWTSKNSQGYVNPAGLAADACVFSVVNGKLSVLLTQRTEEPLKDYWALPGGFVGETEDPQETITRKLYEKTHLDSDKVYLEQLRTYAQPERDPRGWIVSICYLALVDRELLLDDQLAHWFDVNELPDLAFDHAAMIQEGIERLKGKLWFSNIAVGLLPEEFTLFQAQKVYQAIAQVDYDKANFRRDLKASKFIKPTGNQVVEGRGRPAATYRFVSRELNWK